jgi:hypothetical protein
MRNLSIFFMFNAKSDYVRKGTRTEHLSWLHSQDRFNPYCSLFLSCHSYRCLCLDYCWVLISELTVTLLNDRMVNTRNGWGDAEAHQVNEPNPPLSPILAQAIASILESRDEQIELLRQLVAAMGLGMLSHLVLRQNQLLIECVPRYQVYTHTV